MLKDRRTTKDFLETVYEGKLLQFMAMVFGSMLTEDGAPIHRSKLPKDWRELRLIPKFESPPNSPDLNPIENIWVVLKDVVQHHSPRPRTAEDMKAALVDEWNKIPKEALHKLWTCMRERMIEVINAKGAGTHLLVECNFFI